MYSSDVDSICQNSWISPVQALQYDIEIANNTT
jgi:hypothetical protein